MREILFDKQVLFEEKRMFGGHAFMVDGKMCFGTFQGGLMARVNPDKMEQLLQRPEASQMIHGGRAMKGYLTIDAVAINTKEKLNFWIEECLEFNPLAKASKKKK